MEYSCTLFDKKSETFLLIEQKDGKWKIFEGKTEDDLTSVSVYWVETHGDEIIAYLSDDRLIYVPSGPGLKTETPQVSKWLTAVQMHEHESAISEHPFDHDYIDESEDDGSPFNYTPAWFKGSDVAKDVDVKSFVVEGVTYV